MKTIRKTFFYILSFFLGNIFYAKKMGVKIGSGCRLYVKKFGSEPFLIEIGNNVTITQDVKFITHDGSTWLIRDAKGRRYLFRRIIIRDNVFIGMNSIIMPGVSIGNNVIVAAGSVITKSVPSGVVIGGNPAKTIMMYEDYKQRVLDSYISDVDMDYSLSYQERILKILDKVMKPEIK